MMIDSGYNYTVDGYNDDDDADDDGDDDHYNYDEQDFYNNNDEIRLLFLLEIICFISLNMTVNYRESMP